VVPKNKMNSTSCRQPIKLNNRRCGTYAGDQQLANRPPGGYFNSGRLMQVLGQHDTHHAGDQDASPHRQPEQQVQRGRRADDLRQVGRGNGDLQKQALQPVKRRRQSALPGKSLS
jgi:hypothetical protein